MKLHLMDIIIIIGYLIICLALGLRRYKRVKTMVDYTLGGRAFSTAILIITTTATAISAHSTVGITESAHKLGILFIIPIMSLPICWFIMSRLMCANFDLFKKKKFMTFSDIMGHLYGTQGRWITNIYVILDTLIVTSIDITVLGYLFHHFLGISEMQGALVGITIVTLYSAMGGIRADVTTDVLQFVIFVIVLPITLKIGLDKVGGIQNLFSSLPTSHSTITLSSIPTLLGLLFVTLLPNVDIPFMQRALLAKNKQQLARTFSITGLFHLPFAIIMSLLGLTLYSINAQTISNFDLHLLISNNLPTGLIGFAIAGMLAITMSTQDSYLNATSTIIARDICKKICPTLTDSKQLFIARLSCVLIASLSIFLVYSKPSIYGLLWSCANFWYSVVGFPLLIGLLKIKIGNRALIPLILSTLAAVMTTRYFTGDFNHASLFAGFVTMVIFVYFASKRITNLHHSLFVTLKQFQLSMLQRLKDASSTSAFDLKTIYILSSFILGTEVISLIIFPMSWNFILCLRVAIIVSCILLLVHDLWTITNQKKFTLPLWNLLIFFCLSAASSYMMFSSNYNPIRIIGYVVSIVFLFMLTKPIVFIAFSIFGTLCSYILFIVLGENIKGLLTDNFSALFSLFSTSIIMGIYFHKSYVHKLLLARSESKANETKVALRFAISAKKEFLSKINHEIRTSLQGIISITDELSKNWERCLPYERRMFLDMAMLSNKRLSNYAKNILDIADYKAGNLPLKIERTDIRKIVRKAIIITKEQIISEKKPLSIELDDHLLGDTKIYCDKFKISEVISHLLTNAIKYSTEGKILVTIKRPTDSIQISIADEGVGIQRNEKLKIFEPFTEGKRTKTYAKGKGLGLTICNEIIALHKGQLWVEDNTPRGAKFILTLPRTKVKEVKDVEEEREKELLAG